MSESSIQNALNCRPAFALALIITLALAGQTAARTVRFDLAPVAAAAPPPVAADSLATTWAGDQMLQVELKISALLVGGDPDSIDQWTVRVVPREAGLYVADYSPRTKTISDIDGSIDFTKTNEQSNAFGLASNGSYAGIHGKAGLDQVKKDIESVHYKKIAPKHAITAAGTTHRGRGVYFKIRAGSQTVLEGEKRFRIAFRVPPSWRVGTLDVDISAQKSVRSFPAMESKLRTIDAQHFNVAIYHAGDSRAKQAAWDLATAEQAVWKAAMAQANSRRSHSLPELLQSVVSSVGEETVPSTVWVGRLIAGHADPYIDKAIQSLPVELRVAALDYCDARRAIERLAGDQRGDQPTPCQTTPCQPTPCQPTPCPTLVSDSE